MMKLHEAALPSVSHLLTFTQKTISVLLYTYLAKSQKKVPSNLIALIKCLIVTFRRVLLEPSKIDHGKQEISAAEYKLIVY